MTLEINQKQAVILRDLVKTEIDYLQNEAIPGVESGSIKLPVENGVNLLKQELQENKDLLVKLNAIIK